MLVRRVYHPAYKEHFNAGSAHLSVDAKYLFALNSNAVRLRSLDRHTTCQVRSRLKLTESQGHRCSLVDRSELALQDARSNAWLGLLILRMVVQGHKCPILPISVIGTGTSRGGSPSKWVDPQIEQCSTAQLRIVQPALGIALECDGQIGKHSSDVSNDFLLVDESLYLSTDREESRPDRFHEEEFLGLGHLGQVCCLTGIDCDLAKRDD